MLRTIVFSCKHRFCTIPKTAKTLYVARCGRKGLLTDVTEGGVEEWVVV